VVLGGPKVRALLAVLLLHRGEVVSTDRLIDALWGEHASATAAKTVQVYVSNLRKALGDGLIVTQTPGYLLQTTPGQVDLERFDELAAEGRGALESGDPHSAARTLRDALGLWRGPALADFSYEPFAHSEIARLEDARLAAIEDRIDADLATGEHTALVSELESLVREHPARERFQGQLMLSLYRSGRQGDALASYRKARRSLGQELGLEPGRALQELERAILAQDPALDPPSRRSGVAASRRRRGGLLIAAGGAVLAAVIALAAVRLAGSGASSVHVAPNSVAAIDPRTNSVTGAVPVGSSPGAITFGLGSLWVANVDDQTVSRVDPRSLRTLRTFSLAGPPTGLAATAQAIWVAQAAPQASIALASPQASIVSVNSIDAQYDTVGRTERLGNISPGGPGFVASQGDELWVAPSAGLLARLDPVTGRVAQQLDPNTEPAAIAIGAGAVWVTDNGADNVTRIDPTGALTPIAVGLAPSGIAVGAGGVWVADSLDDALVRISPTTNSVTTTIPVGSSPGGVAVGEGSVWVANGGDGTVTRIDPITGKVVATINVGGSPQAVTVADGRVWVTIDAPIIKPAEVAHGGVLRIDSPADVDSMDPALAYFSLSWQLLDATCAKLVSYPDKPDPVGSELTAEVAKSLPARSADGQTYTFTIRKGFRFSPPSNQPVTAQTFNYTIERTLSPRMKSPSDYQFTDIVGARAYIAGRASHITGVTARGDKLTIRLVAPAPDLPARMAENVMCAVPDNTPIEPKGLPTIPMAGPYYIASYAPGQGVVLKRNPNYRDRRPHSFAQIDLAVNVSPKQVVAHIEAGTADYANSSFDAASLAPRYGAGNPAAAKGNQQYFVNRVPVLWFFTLNTRRPLFSDERLRQAVNYAANRDALAQVGGFLGPPLQPSDQYLPPGMPGYRDVQVYPFTPDVTKARQLAHGRRGTAVLYTCNEPTCDKQAQIMKTDLAPIGLNLEIREFPFATLYYKVNHDSSWDIADFSWAPDYPDPVDFLDLLLERGTEIPTFNDPTYRRRLARAAELSGPARYLAYGTLAADLDRNAAPFVAYGNQSSYDFFSARIGCQMFGAYGMDLAALCIRKRHR